MKAAYYTNYGSPDVIEIKDLPRPIPKDNQVLIKIKATTVNRTDCGIRNGTYLIMKFFTGFTGPRKKILGTDFSGIVEQVGKDITKFKVGDRVLGFNDEGIQSQAEYLALDEKQTHLMQEGLTFEQAAASLEGVHYAFNFMNKVDLRSGQKALVYGSTGSIGSALVQLLKNEGIHVTAVCDTPNIEKIKSLKPDRVIDYKVTEYWKEDVVYDYVFDAVGKSSFAQSKSVLSKKGVYISSELGDNAENIYLSIFTPLGRGKVVKFPLPVNVGRTIKMISRLLAEGKYTPLIDRVYPFDEIVDAYRYVEKGFKVGNVVIRF